MLRKYNEIIHLLNSYQPAFTSIEGHRTNAEAGLFILGTNYSNAFPRFAIWLTKTKGSLERTKLSLDKLSIPHEPEPKLNIVESLVITKMNYHRVFKNQSTKLRSIISQVPT